MENQTIQKVMTLNDKIVLDGLVDFDYNDKIDEVALYKPYARSVRALRLSPNIVWIGDESIDSYENDKGSRNSNLLTILDKAVVTGKYCAFVGNRDSTLTIRSRFAPHNDCFLLYMLSKVYNIDPSHLSSNSCDISLLSLYEFLLPSLLMNAVSRGWYKEYVRKEYNDSRVKGVVDVARHIKKNVPFHGKIAYNVREYSFDNRITQLIRHAVEYILTKPFGRAVMSQNEEFRKIVSILRNVTPVYNRGQRVCVIKNGLRPISHPLYYTYEQLRKICVHILRQDKTSYISTDTKDEIYGIVIDMPYLWEEYLAIVLKDYEHPSNRNGTGRRHLDFELNLERYPDFIKDDHIVIDAKYKFYDRVVDNREDLAQIISYMHCFNIDKGVLIHPENNFSCRGKKYTLKGYGGTVQILSLNIPTEVLDFHEFSEKMDKKEENLRSQLRSVMKWTE